MKLLPIVSGCRALIVRAYQVEAIGKEVIVTGPQYSDGDVCGFCSSRLWWPCDDGYSACSCCLLRIDGGDFSKEREPEKVREKA